MKLTFDRSTIPARAQRGYRTWIMTLHRGGRTMDLHLSGTFRQAKADAMDEARALDCERVSVAGVYQTEAQALCLRAA